MTYDPRDVVPAYQNRCYSCGLVTVSSICPCGAMITASDMDTLADALRKHVLDEHGILTGRPYSLGDKRPMGGELDK